MSKYGTVFRFGMNLGSGARNVTKLKFYTEIMLEMANFVEFIRRNSNFLEIGLLLSVQYCLYIPMGSYEWQIDQGNLLSSLEWKNRWTTQIT